jgi:hypothetical protein
MRGRIQAANAIGVIGKGLAIEGSWFNDQADRNADLQPTDW